MINPAQAAEAIKAFLANPMAQPDAALAEASVSFAAACRSVNARIDRCVEFLNAGFRTEAVFWAEEFPALFDLYRICDLPGGDEWIQASEMNSTAELVLEIPPALRRKDMQRITHAYDEEERIRPLLRRQRRQALAGAPIRDRLETLRSLLQADPAHPGWPEDVAEMEAARRGEIEGEFARALEADNLAALRELQNELSTPNWSDEKLNAPLLAKIKDARTNMRRYRAGAAYDQLIPKLEAAHGALAVGEAGEWRRQWVAITQKSGFPPSDGQAGRAAPVFAWLAEEDAREQKEREFSAACAELEKSLDDDAPNIDIERKLRAAENFGIEVPERLRQMAERKLSIRQALVKRSFRLKFAAAAVSMLIVLLTGWGLHSRSQSRRIDDWKREIAEKIAAFEFPAARALFSGMERQDPELTGLPDFAALAADLDRKEAEENSRLERLNAMWARHESEGDAFSDWPELERLSRTDGEKERCRIANERRTAEARREFAARRNEIERTLEVLRGKIRSWDVRSGDGFNASFLAYLKSIDDLSDWTARPEQANRIDANAMESLTALRAAGEAVSGEAQAANARAQAANAQAQATNARVQTERDRFDRLKAGVASAIADGDVDRYGQALNAFSVAFPAEAAKEGWTKAAALAPWLQGRVSTSRLITSLSAALAAGKIEAGEAAEILKEVERLKKSGAIKEDADYFRWIMTAEVQLKRRVMLLGDEAKAANAALTDCLDAKMTGDVYWYREKDGFLAYMEKPPETSGNREAVIMHYKTKRTSRDDMVRRKIGAVYYDIRAELAPHSRFASEAKKKLASGEPREETAFYLRLAQECLEYKDMDPIMRIHILHLLLAASPPDAGKFNQLSERVEALHKKYALLKNGALAEWWLTEDPDIEERKKVIEAALKKLPASPGEIAAERTKSAAWLRENRPPPAEWAGCLFQDADGQWRFSGQLRNERGKHVALLPGGEEAALMIDASGGLESGGDWFNGQPVLFIAGM